MDYQTNPLQADGAVVDGEFKYLILDRSYGSMNSPPQYAPVLPQYMATTNPAPAACEDIVDKILFDKRDIVRQRIASLAEQIESRRELYQQNMYHMLQQDCAICTKIDIVDSFRAFYLDPTKMKRKQSLEGELHQLHKERRSERVSAWGDIQRVYRDLLDAVEEYRNAKRSESIVAGDENGEG